MHPNDPSPPVPPAALFDYRRRLSLFSALAAVALVAHFLYLAQFGLYEDDYFYTLPVFGWDWSMWWGQVQDAILHPIQGRPLNHAVRRTLFFLSLNHGGLQTAYVVSWAMVTTNACLVFNFVRRVLSPRAAIAAALMFIVYPIDTSRQLLMHQSDLHFSAFLLLCALNLYVRGRPGFAFAVAALTLVSYESYYLPFVAAPLLVATWKPVRWTGLLLHGAGFSGVAGGVLLTRRLLGESRATEMIGNLGEVLGRIAAAGPIGVGHSLQAMLLRPVDAAMHASPFAWLLGVLVGLGVWRWLARTAPAEAGDSREVSPALLGWVAGGALLAWLASYVLSFRAGYYPPIVSIGRLTGVHAAGTFGAAMGTAVVAEFAFRLKPPAWRSTCAALFGSLIGFSVTFGLEIQRSEYASHWVKQVGFYRSLIALVGDLREGELIVLDSEGDPAALPITPGFPRFGTVNYTQLAFAKFATWPAAWRTAPAIAVLWTETPVQPVADGLALFTPPWRHAPPAGGAAPAAGVPVARDDHFIYLKAEGGQLRRISGPVNLRGHMLTARAPTAGSPAALGESALLGRLTRDFDYRAWFTLRDARNYPP